MFTPEQRDALRARVLAIAESDDRVVAGAAVGSLAGGGGDRFSDLDLTFAVSDAITVASVLDDWTRSLVESEAAVHLIDLERGATTYRVFLFPDALQFDLSMAPASEFRPLGPRFRLLFGQVATGTPADPPGRGTLFISTRALPADVFGWGVIYALHARACIERGRLWQAEHYVGAVRDHGLALACFREGMTAVQARGYDDLTPPTLDRFSGTLIASRSPSDLRRALASAVEALLAEAFDAQLPSVREVEKSIAELRRLGG